MAIFSRFALLTSIIPVFAALEGYAQTLAAELDPSWNIKVSGSFQVAPFPTIICKETCELKRVPLRL